MSKKLIAHVYVADPDGNPRLFSPGEKVPKWARKLIDNPKAWAEVEDVQEPDIEDDDDGDDDTPIFTSVEAELAGAGVPAEDIPAAAENVEALTSAASVPAKTGPGSSVEAWKAYATASGFEFDADVKRDEIIKALEADGIPTE